MSVWGTWLDLDADDHANHCAKWQPFTAIHEHADRYDADGSTWRLNDNTACDCEAGPIAYRGSHILPSNADPRAGAVDVGAVNTFVRRDGRDTPAELETDAVHPWLRLSVNSETVILDRGQVAQLRTTLDAWDEMVEERE